eukprot:Tamp_12985.p1 GENE.Tamp_12985~~Tamp_12985.p1  ORF type:complete len:463 (-),score=55.46 Tamp_12985:373-1722(-)
MAACVRGRRSATAREVERLWMMQPPIASCPQDAAVPGEQECAVAGARAAGPHCRPEGTDAGGGRRRAVQVDGGCMPVLCVRSGLHLLCSCLKLPRGSEVLMSALNIPDVPAILEHHGLVCVPVDLDVDTLTADLQKMEAAVTDKTRMILIAHVYGVRAEMDGVVQLASRCGLLLVEDCAEALAGMEYKGHAEADVALFSFGPIKFCSVFQGGMMQVRDAGLLTQLRQLHATWPLQPRLAYLWRCVKFVVLVLLQRPLPIWLIMCSLRLLGLDHQKFFVFLIRSYSRSLSFHALLLRLQLQPSTALLHALKRRFKHALVAAPPDNRKQGRRMVELLEATPSAHQGLLSFPGRGAKANTYWVFPMLVQDAAGLVSALQAAGIDASRGSTQIAPVSHSLSSEGGECCERVEWMKSRLVFLPVSYLVPDCHLRRIALLVDRLLQAQTQGVESC